MKLNTYSAYKTDSHFKQGSLVEPLIMLLLQLFLFATSVNLLNTWATKKVWVDQQLRLILFSAAIGSNCVILCNNVSSDH